MATMTHRLPGQTDHLGAWAWLQRQRGRLALDVGANIGQAAKVLAEGFERVVAFEPCCESFDILMAEAQHNVLPINAAVTDRKGPVTLTESAQSIATGQLTTGEGLAWGATVGHRTVPGNTLDWWADELGVPELVVIDTEGHEVHVLRGASLLIAAGVTFYVEVHRAEHETLIDELCPGYSWQTFFWPTHYEDFERANHFWMVGEKR